jgi:hypothetical protein
MEKELAELKEQVAVLTKELSRVSDEAEVRKVHFKYGYFLDKCLYNEVSIYPSARWIGAGHAHMKHLGRGHVLGPPRCLC